MLTNVAKHFVKLF